MRRAAALACLATIVAADHVIHRRRPRWILVGLFDVPAHAATAGLVLVNLPPRSIAWSSAFLAGSLLPDIDHVPLLLRPVRPTLDDPRPVSHCLAAVAPVAGLAAATGNPRLAAAAGGMLAHFARDLGVGTGVPLLWPATRRPVRVPYAAYAAACTLLAARSLRGEAAAR
jgi:membrane-bound metal-dependent hydrolase YbcI (DUF457 family)